MSQRPSASRPASRSPPEGHRFVLPPVQLRDDRPHDAWPAERPPGDAEGRGRPPHVQTAPPHAPPASGGEDGRTSRQSRDLGVHSMLNPSEPEAEHAGRRMSGVSNASPISTAGPASSFGASPSTAASSRTGGGARGMGVGTIDAQQTPFLLSRGRDFMGDPGPPLPSEVPPTPPPPGHHPPPHYGRPPTASTPTAAPRRASGGTMPAPGHTPLSQSASPSISASSHNPPSSQTSPASFLYQKGAPPPLQPQPPHAGSSYYPGASFGSTVQAGGGMQFQAPPGGPEGPYSAPAPAPQSTSLHSSSANSSRQTSASDPIQVLTITTSEGSYTVPVDVHQASRLADEKRARNAGASARFRQRRKEKEKEANTSIEKLQQQTRELERKLRDVEQERDRYRHERDRLREIVHRSPEGRHLATQGPPSPPSVRFGGTGMDMGMGHPPPAAQMGYHSDTISERAPRRRRMDAQGEFASIAYSLPPASALPPVPTSGFPPAPANPGPQSLPPLRMDHASAPQGLDPHVPPSGNAVSQPPFDTYARGPYERGWTGDAGRR